MWLLMCASAIRAAEPLGTSICTNCCVVRIEEVAGGDEECGAAVSHLVALAAVRKPSDRQEALREDGVRVGDVIAPRLDERDELKEPILARLHGAPSSRASFSWIASSIQWCRDGGTRLRADARVSMRAMSCDEQPKLQELLRTVIRASFAGDAAAALDERADRRLVSARSRRPSSFGWRFACDRHR